MLKFLDTLYYLQRVQITDLKSFTLGLIRTNEYKEERPCIKCGYKCGTAMDMFKHIKEQIHNIQFIFQSISFTRILPFF